jgi:hypothetical protein
MTRHEQDRVHEASGIAFTFAGHLVWGNPKLSEGLHGDVEAWRCGRCNGLVVGEVEATDTHAEQCAQLDETREVVATLRDTIDKLAHGAFKPVEVPGAVISDQPKVERERRNPPATAHEMGADVERLHRVARWREAATVREVPIEYPDREHVDGLVGREEGSAARATAQQLRADGLDEPGNGAS